MNWPVFMHALGVVCLGAMFAAGVWMIVTSLVPQRGRIVSLALGNVEPGFHTLFPEASSARPVLILRAQLDAVESGPQLIREVV